MRNEFCVCMCEGYYAAHEGERGDVRKCTASKYKILHSNYNFLVLNEKYYYARRLFWANLYVACCGCHEMDYTVMSVEGRVVVHGSGHGIPLRVTLHRTEFSSISTWQM